jgi:hypothetical protein
MKRYYLLIILPLISIMSAACGAAAIGGLDLLSEQILAPLIQILCREWHAAFFLLFRGRVATAEPSTVQSG